MGWESTQELLTWGYKTLKNSGLFLILFFMLTACVNQGKLSVFSDYVTQEYLASYHVGTPDPSLNAPTIGQRIYVRWNLAKNHGYCELTLKLRVRFKDRSEITEYVQLNQPCGMYTYSILNEEYFARNGIMTYKIELLGDGQRIDEWQHQMWVELVIF